MECLHISAFRFSRRSFCIALRHECAPPWRVDISDVGIRDNKDVILPIPAS
jgi:hypothetical protein